MRLVLCCLCLGLAFSVSSVTFCGDPDGPIAHWTFDKTLGFDSIGGRNGTLRSFRNLTGDVPIPTIGLIGSGAASFNGSSVIDFGIQPALNLGTGDLSISAWIKTSHIGQNRIVAHGSAGSKVDGWSFMTWSAWGNVTAGGIVFLVGRDGVGELAFGSCFSVSDGDWHHVAVLVNRSGLSRMFVNGSQIVLCGGKTWAADWGPRGLGDLSSYIETNISTNCSFCIGISCQYHEQCIDSTESFVGSLDDLAIWDRVISVSQVRDLASGGPPCSPPVNPAAVSSGETSTFIVLTFDTVVDAGSLEREISAIISRTVKVMVVERIGGRLVLTIEIIGKDSEIAAEEIVSLVNNQCDQT